MTETCASAHIGGVNIVLLEGITPDIQYVQTLSNFCLICRYYDFFYYEDYLMSLNNNTFFE